MFGFVKFSFGKVSRSKNLWKRKVSKSRKKFSGKVSKSLKKILELMSIAPNQLGRLVTIILTKFAKSRIVTRSTSGMYKKCIFRIFCFLLVFYKFIIGIQWIFHKKTTTTIIDCVQYRD